VGVGYEVLDTDGARLELPSTPVPPEEVVAFDDLASQAPDSTGAIPQPRTGRRDWPLLSPDPLPFKRFGLASAISAALVLLVVGWAVGGSLATRHAERVREAERASRLAVVASIVSLDTVPGSELADFTVRLVNAGPLPVSLVLSADGDVPTTTIPVVRPLGGAGVVPAGGSLSASLRLAVDCTGTQDLGNLLRVPVRTSDGDVHYVVALDDGAARSTIYGGSPCNRGYPALDATVGGTLDHPVLRLHNTTHRLLRVTLDLDSSPFIAQSTNFSVLHLSPALPQVLAPDGRIDLALTLVPWSCPEGLAVVLNSQVSPYVVLLSGYPGAGTLAQDRIGVDLSTLWGAALARNCK
jgi:hypothetical protein